MNHKWGPVKCQVCGLEAAVWRLHTGGLPVCEDAAERIARLEKRIRDLERAEALG